MVESLKSDSGQLISLKTQCKNRLDNMFYQIQEKFPKVSQFILVLDNQGSKIISSAMKTSELIEKGISAFERLDLKRKKFPQMHAIYLISPSAESIKKLLEDFQPNQIQYGFVHLYLTNAISNDLMQQISKNSDLISRIKTFVEINQDYYCIDEDSFSIDIPDANKILYTGSNQEINKKCEEISSKLITMVQSYDKFYEFEILYNESSVNQICKNVATSLKSSLEILLENLQQKDNEIVDKDSGKISILLLDRSMDLVTPIMHDFYYQPMAFDILKVENNIVQINDQKELLNSEDNVFSKYKSLHLSQTIDGIRQEILEVIKNNPEIKKKESGQKIDTAELSQMMRKFPKYQQAMKKLSLHQEITSQCYQEFSNYLKDLGDLEQSMSTTMDENSSKVSEGKLLIKVSNFLNSEKLTPELKFRLILTTILALELSDKDKKGLMTFVNEENAKIIQNLEIFGCKLSSSSTKFRIDANIVKEIKAISQGQEYLLCRHIPMVQIIQKQIFEQIISMQPISINLGKIKLKSMKINERKGGLSSPLKKAKLGQVIKKQADDEFEVAKKCSKFIVFIVGGLSYIEIRALRNIQQKPENMFFTFGSTGIFKPSDYIQMIKNIA